MELADWMNSPVKVRYYINQKFNASFVPSFTAQKKKVYMINEEIEHWWNFNNLFPKQNITIN